MTDRKKKILFKTGNILPVKRPIYGIALLVEYGKNKGASVERLLEDTRIEPDHLNDPDKLITTDQELNVIRNLVRLVPDPGIGLELSRNATVSANAHITIPAMFCDTFQEAIHLMFKYIEISLSYFQYSLSVENNLAFLKLKELFDYGELQRVVFELELSAIYSISKNILGEPIALKKIDVAYPRPQYAPFYQEMFCCPISFDADEHAMIFDSRLLSKQLPQANALVRDAYEKECRRVLARIRGQGTTVEKISHELLILGKNIPSFQKLAGRLNMSPRTLRRRLTAERTSYKSLINSFLKEKAVELLDDTDYSLEKIAEELGYSSASNFCHAFKNWTGQTPSGYREKKTDPA